MPFFDDLRTLREKAGCRKSDLAKAAGLSADTITRIEKHKNATQETLIKVVNALNEIHHEKVGSKILVEQVITPSSRFGEGKDNVHHLSARSVAKDEAGIMAKSEGKP